MINGKADEVVKELFESLLKRYQNNLEKLMKCSEFVFSYVRLLYYKCHKINLNCGGSINPVNKRQMLSISCNSRIKA